MMKTFKMFVLTLGIVVVVVACTSTQEQTVGDEQLTPATPIVEDDEAQAGLPNPAAVYCEEQGGTLETRSDEAGGEYGVCQFADGTECEEWAFYREECQPGDTE